MAMPLAFFDMDRTLLTTSSGMRYVGYLWRRRRLRPAELLGVLLISAQYSLNAVDFPQAMARMSRSVKGGDAAATRALCDQWFEDDLRRFIAPRAVARVREHQQRGEQVILLSASTQFAVRPVAEHLGIAYRSTELEIARNRLTGAIAGPPCYGEGKCYWGRRLAEQNGVPLQDCTFYTDSYSDRSLMEAVGHPVAVNPDRRLKALAREKGWPVEYFY